MEQLRSCTPSGEKGFSDLQIATLQRLQSSFALTTSLNAIRLEEAEERRKALDKIEVPTMKKVGKKASLRTYQSWWKTLMVTMKLYELTDVEVAGLLRKQLKGQARGLLKHQG